MKVIGIKKIVIEEILLESKSGNPSGGEDLIFIGENIIAVIDGATSKNDNEFKDKSTGRSAAELLVN